MTNTMNSVSFETSFGKFVPCDLPTYKKIKKIRHLLGSFVYPQAERWAKAQRRFPKNRYYKYNGEKIEVNGHPAYEKKRRIVEDSWIFSPFWSIKVGEQKITGTRLTGPSCLIPTPLLKKFQDDYYSARNPVESPEKVTPLSLSLEEIDDLLLKIEEWCIQNKK